MFKNLTPYRLATDPSLLDTALLRQHLAQTPFTDCTPSQAASIGWVAPRGTPHAPLVDSVGGQRLAALMFESKLLPSAVVKRRVDALAAQVERETGRKPGAKLKRDLKEQATHELLPRAFSKRTTVRVWIDPARQLLLVDATSPARADAVVAQLVHDVAGLVVAPLHTALAPAAAMADWLAGGAEPPSAFSIDRDCELKSDDESQAAVRYARHRLDTDEVRRHVAHGKRPTRLALTWQGRVSFTLLASGQLKAIQLLDVVLEGRSAADDADAAFDADAAIATGELAPLLADLIDALGGERAPAAREPETAVAV